MMKLIKKINKMNSLYNSKNQNKLNYSVTIIFKDNYSASKLI